MVIKGHIGKATLKGSILTKGCMLKGKLNANATLAGSVTLGELSYPKYDGEYEITPIVEEQVLETRQKVMVEDLTIQAIPFYETSNTTGGTTVYIGVLTE